MNPTFQYGYRTELETSVDNKYKYIGIAPCDSNNEDEVWQIRRVELNAAGNVKNIKFAGGNHRFQYRWSDREDLEYK